MEEKELNEIVIIEQLPVIKEKLQLISDEIEKEVEYALSLPCDEETVKDVKNARAKLNKIKTSLEEKRKQVKNAVMSPYNEFETIYNDLVKDKLTKADETLKNRVDFVEESKKTEKENELRKFVEEHCKANNVHIDFDKIGLNVTLSASMSSLKEQAKQFIEKVASDLKLIEMEEFSSEILYEYNKCFDYVQAKTIVLERKKELDNIEQQQKNNENVENSNIVNEEKVNEIIAPIEIEETYVYQFTVNATKTQAKQITEFMDSIGVTYE